MWCLWANFSCPFPRTKSFLKFSVRQEVWTEWRRKEKASWIRYAKKFGICCWSDYEVCVKAVVGKFWLAQHIDTQEKKLSQQCDHRTGTSCPDFASSKTNKEKHGESSSVTYSIRDRTKHGWMVGKCLCLWAKSVWNSPQYALRRRYHHSLKLFWPLLWSGHE